MRRLLVWVLTSTVYLSTPIHCLAQVDERPPAASVADPRCRALEEAALVNDVPLEFLTRLIWQESRFDNLAISRAGARGIAQFMPGTANEVKLADPFDAVTAIHKSAQFLRVLRQQFGNLGLAAAAYNAGPKRVSDWLRGRRALPQETMHYVQIVTGHPADWWRNMQPSTATLGVPVAVPCPEIVRSLPTERTVAAREPLTPIKDDAPSRPAWGVQLISNASQAAALAEFHKLQKTYRSVLESHEPLVLRSSVGRNASWYRVRVGADTRNDAERLCSSLRAVGGSCLVQSN
jgi:transglycosylase-like protein with SLT domain/sporulation related protein